ncbi:MAG: M48 family metalloprotease [Mariprofundales bacterium]|nr:M48 family metalloprotease [Mariprofundales bacterium]
MLLLFALLCSACAVNPVSKHSEFVMMSEDQELQLGQQMAAKFAKELPLLLATDPLAQYVDRVGQKVAAHADRPELIYRFHVVDDDTINAFALPGGYIYIYRGLLNRLNSESELAAVLGHEIGHVTARHAVQRYTKIQSYQLGMVVASIFVPGVQAAGGLTDLLAGAVVQGYGRKDESQADQLSIKYITAAGYDPYATVQLLKTLKRVEALDVAEKRAAGDQAVVYHGAFASHPKTGERIKDAAVTLGGSNDASASVINPVTDHALMLDQLSGQPYAGSVVDGAVVGQRFIHPQLGVALQFPDGWVIHNGRTALAARVRRQKVYFQMSRLQLAKHRTAEALLEKLVPKRRIRGEVTHGRRAGRQWARAQVDLSQPHVSEARVDFSVWVLGGHALLIAMWCPRSEIDRWQGQFNAIISSFHAYRQDLDGTIPRIDLARWKVGDSWQRFADQSKQSLGPMTAAHLAVLNGFDVGTAPSVGYLIKLVR